MEEWKKVASQLDKDHAKGRPTRSAQICTEAHFPHADVSFLFPVLRIQEGQSRHQEEVIRHHQTAEEG